MTHSRKERRALSARAAKQYGIKGEAALKIHDAYKALEAGNIVMASKTAAELAQAGTKSEHPWIILGAIALDRKEGETAHQFFVKAREYKPKSVTISSGMGKAFVLMADPFTAVLEFQDAIKLGSQEVAMANLYGELMRMMGRHKAGADNILKMAHRGRVDALYRIAGELYLAGDFFPQAASCFQEAYRIAPTAPEAKVGKVKADMLTHDYDSVLTGTEALLNTSPSDELIVMRMNAQRVKGEFDKALATFERHDFESTADYQRGLMVRANIEQDLGQDAAALATYQDASYVSDQEEHALGKVLGSFLLRRRDVDAAWPHYALRQPKANRAAIPLENSDPDNLSGRARVFLMDEQGVGDQMALLPMAVAALWDLGVKEVFFVTEGRIADALRENTLSVTCISKEDFDNGSYSVDGSECVFLADLCRYLGGLCASGQLFGGYVEPDPEAVAAQRASYRKIADGRPIYGISWKSAGSLSGYVRSVALNDILARLPENAMVVSLQYGDVADDVWEARKAFPGMNFLEDQKVDPVADIRGALVQLAAVDHVITIDNTTAHAAGAIGHPDATVLLPCGSERMWYWGVEGEEDRWYGCLKVLAQSKPRDWDSVLERLS